MAFLPISMRLCAKYSDPAWIGTGFGRAALEGQSVHIPDVKSDPEYTLPEGTSLGDFRTLLGVPLLREGCANRRDRLDALDRATVHRQADRAGHDIRRPGRDRDRERAPVREVEARTRELAKSLEELRTTQDRLVQTQKLALLGQLTAGIAHEIKNPLNFVNNFSGISSELIDELQDTLKDIPLDDKARAEIKELTEYAEGQFRQGRASWQTRGCHRQEYAAALARRLG